MLNQRIEQLRDQYRECVVALRRMQGLADEEKRSFNAEEQENWDKLNSDLTQTEQSLQRELRLQEAENKMAEPANTPAPLRRQDSVLGPPQTREITPRQSREMALGAWFRNHCNMHISDEQRAAARRSGIQLGAREIEIELYRDFDGIKAQLMPGAQQRQLGLDPTGPGITDDMSTLVPTGFVYELERTRLWFGGMLQVAGVWRTESGNPTHWPTSDDTANKGFIVQEGMPSAEAYATYGEVIFGAYKFSSGLVLVSQEAIEDSAFDMGSLVARDLGERLGRALNQWATVGTGTSEPEGILTNATVGVPVTGAYTAVTDVDVINLAHEVDIAYRGTARYMLHDKFLAHLRTIKTGEDWALWQPAPLMGLQEGLASTIYGYPYTVNNDMQWGDDAGDKVLIFGELSKFKIREVRGVRLRVMNERYGELDMTGFLAFQRWDSKPIQASAYRALSVSVGS